MGKKRTYYKDLDLIRIFFCVAVLLYHLNILRGGYLAVCSFLSLSGYLSCISAFKKEKFSLRFYYLNRLKKIYLPLVIVVFITVFFVSLFKDILWINLKPEVTSVLLGYNNFWQLSVNMDYFARHINSPFMHLWYISILLQFDLIFPFLYLLLKKIGDKIHKIIPCIITILLSIIGTIYFYMQSLNGNIMVTYYDTFTRVFSLLFGLSFGFISSYYNLSVPKIFQKRLYSRIIFYTYLCILLVLFCLVGADSIYFEASMLATTIITCRLIAYGTLLVKDKLSIGDKIIKLFASLSYEIYLIQYPIIFLFQYLNINEVIKLPILIISILLLSYFLYFVLKSNKKFKVLKYIMLIITLGISVFGCYKYCISKDYTNEMKQLEEQLNKNKLIMNEKQEEYAKKQKEQQDNLNKMLADLTSNEEGLHDIVKNLPIIGVGDSVMLGASPDLYQMFPNSYIDAQTSRTAWVVNGVLKDLKNRNMLGKPIILNVGANGDCSESCKIEIIETCEDRDIFWLNVTNDRDVGVNDKLLSLSNRYPNLHVIDWASISKGHPEYFVADGIHLTKVGRGAYVNAIYESIYNVYLEQYRIKREEIMKEYEKQEKTKISFYGNDIILNSFDLIQEKFEGANFILDKDFNYITLKEQIESKIKDNMLTYNIVLAFDSSFKLKREEYEYLRELCNNHHIYILVTDEETDEFLSEFNYDNVTIINFYQEIKRNPNYMMVDKIHLTKDGNVALVNILEKFIKLYN